MVVVGCGVAPVVGRGTRKTREHKVGVDDQGIAFAVGAQFKNDGAVVGQAVGHLHGNTSLGTQSIGLRPLLNPSAHGSGQVELPLGGDFRQASAKLNSNLTRVCLRADPPFGLYPVVGMQSEVNSRVHFAYRPVLKFGHIPGPFSRIIANQVVPGGFRCIGSCRRSAWRGTYKFRKEGKGIGPMIRPLGSGVVGVGNGSSAVLGVHNADSVSVVLPKYSPIT